MKIRHIFTLFATVLSLQASADSYQDMEPLTLEVPEMKAELVELPDQPTLELGATAPSTSSKMDFDIFK